MTDRSIVQGWNPQDKRSYVYGYFYPETYPDGEKAGTCFYVGKGTRDRVKSHEWEAKGKKNHRYQNAHKVNTIKLIWAAGEQVQKVILSYFDTEQEAFQYEIALIFLFESSLTNLTLGGEGVVGASEETRVKMSKAQKGKKRILSEEQRARLSASHKGRVTSQETRDVLSSLAKKRVGVLSEESRRKRSESMKRAYQEGRVKRQNLPKGYSVSPEHRRKISEAKKGKSHSEETRRKISEALRGSNSSGAFRQGEKKGPMPEEQRVKISQAMKGHRAARAYHSSGFTGHKHSEETRLKMSQTRQARKEVQG